MKFKELKGCFPCVFQRKKSVRDEDYNVRNGNGAIPPEADDEYHLNYVTGLDFCVKFNGDRHHTEKYYHMRRNEGPTLVIRRGDEFKLKITLKRAYDEDRDKFMFLFKCRDKKEPAYSRSTLVGVNLRKDSSENIYSWSAILQDTSENTIVVHIKPSPTCIVGIWDLEVDTITLKRHVFTIDKPIYIIYNPWCENDETYMESELWREETVSSADGLIWRSLGSNSPTAWKYGQYERDILDCSLQLVTNIGGLSGNMRASLVTVCRAISAAVNANNDGGVVVGRWGKDYPGGKVPWYWTGSVEILQKYYETKTPVSYGQCWVFAGVLTTVCRALGLPSRVVTNFASAHDSDGSITIDYFVDTNGKMLENSDSIWNFHVWSEVWMKRNDLGELYDGWQVIDATPQEESNGKFRCGPASVAACKQGDVQKPYDLPFVFSEVNADKVYWTYNEENSKWLLLKKETNAIGLNISTKAAGTFSRLDLTDDYKYPEGSENERAVYLKSMRQIDHEFSRIYQLAIFDDVVFKFGYLEDVIVGQNFTVSLNVENRSKSNADHEISITLRVDVFSYTGKFLGEIMSSEKTVTVPANDKTAIDLNIGYEHYRKVLEDNCVFVESCIAQVKGTDFRYYDRDEFKVSMPDIRVDVEEVTSIGRVTTAEVSLKNPLPKALKKGKFFIEAPGLSKKLTIDVHDKIPVGDTIVKKFKFTPDQLGKQTIVAKFTSKELSDVNGFSHIAVNE